MKIGLTGGIGAGKTIVGRMFVDLGCRLIDSDRITHELLEPGQAVYDAVVREFGRGIVAEDGRIDRGRLGEIVFNEASRREALNRIVHPAVFARQREFLATVQAEDPSAIAIVDAALMVETGSYKNYDKLIVVVCRPDEQRRRLRDRGLSDPAIDSRIAAQMPMQEKARYADFVIDNSGSLEETRRQVEAVYRELKRQAAGDAPPPTRHRQ